MPTKKTKKKLAVKTNKVANLVGGGAAIGPGGLVRTKPLSGQSGGGSGGGHGITTVAQTVASVTAIGSLATGIWASAKNDGGGNKQQ